MNQGFQKQMKMKKWIQEWIKSWNGALISHSDLYRFRHSFIDCWIYGPIISLREIIYFTELSWLLIGNFMEGNENFDLFSSGI